MKLLFSIFVAQLAGLVGSFFTVSSVNSWYLTINKPSWNPPGFIFGPVWISLYTLMGVASYLVWKKKEKKLINIYLIHLVLNSLWSILFFGAQRLDLALIEILVLLLLIGYLTIKFFKVKKLAGVLMIPYLLWVSFATFLNFTIWSLNR
jgi:translocator protein